MSGGEGAVFEFATAGRILFGRGRLKEAGSAARTMGANAMVVTGASSSRAAPLLDLLRREKMEIHVWPTKGEPTVEMVKRGAGEALRRKCGMVIAIGGGSVLAANPGDPLDYLEVIGKGRPIENAPLPFMAIPTTAGTGAEVTRNAVLSSPEHRVKVSLRSPLMLPRVALVDPLLTLGLPPKITAATGMDALTQVIEPFVSVRANPLADAICLKGMTRAARSLRRVFEAGNDEPAREDMALASLCGGLALANSGLGAAHGFAAPLGGMFDAPHGAVCAALLPFVVATNIRALEQRQPDGPSLERYRKVAQTLTARLDATVDDGAAWLRQLSRDLEVPGLKSYGVKDGDIPLVVEKAAASSSMKGNPIVLTREEMAAILQQAM
ncbi:MAG: iron-containing alcohol dehydrogenase [Verrucomicrobiae bacterium]|nr:iron-containing alcohol dehydrogenase [Verrucomicrobiae bacterium]